MNKAQAKQEALENNRTYGELKKLVENTRGKREMSIVNKTLPLDMTLDILSEIYKDKDLDKKPDNVLNYRTGRLGGTGLGIWNLLRECA